jgi:SAM-dependent methyltransferase
VITVTDRAHWDDRYSTIGADEVSWYESEPATSLAFFERLGIRPSDSVIDVGGGASRLVDHLLAAGHSDVAVLDISRVALDEGRARIGDPPQVSWIEADLLSWEPTRRWEVWHDRAVLHFLTDDDDRARYAATMRRALVPRGAFVIGAFAEDGPTECSALPVRRYGAGDFVDLLGDVDVVEQARRIHHTPGGAAQPFRWIAGRLVSTS